MKEKITGHASNKLFQEYNRLIRSFCIDQGFEVNDTASSIIIKHDNKAIEMKVKTSRFTDLNTNLSDDYYNPIARIVMFFNIKTIH